MCQGAVAMSSVRWPPPGEGRADGCDAELRSESTCELTAGECEAVRRRVAASGHVTVSLLPAELVRSTCELTAGEAVRSRARLDCLQ